MYFEQSIVQKFKDEYLNLDSNDLDTIERIIHDEELEKIGREIENKKRKIVGLFLSSKKMFDKLNIRKIILEKFLKAIIPDFIYKPRLIDIDEDLQILLDEKLLKAYNGTPRLINYIEFDSDGSKIIGEEIETIFHTTSSNSRSAITNHCYLYKINFNEDIVDDGELKLLDIQSNNKRNSALKSSVSFLNILLYLFIMMLLLITITALLIIAEFKMTMIIITNILTFIIISGYYFHKHYKKDNSWETKNQEIGTDNNPQDQESITSQIIDIMNKYVKKINSTRIYDLYIKGPYLYLKYDIRQSNSVTNGKFTPRGKLMDVSLFKNGYDNLKDFVEFYMEIKNLKQLVSEIKKIQK